MPVVVMENIIGLLDFRSVLTLRQVCRDFWNFIDDLKDSKLPDSKLKGLTLTVRKGRKLEFKIEYFDGSIDIIEYMENSRTYKEKITNLENSNFLDVAIQNDLKWILKFQRGSSDLFEIGMDLQAVYLRPEDEQLYQDVIEQLSNCMNRKIKTKKLQIWANKNSEFLSIIQIVDPKFVVELNFRPRFFAFETDEISKTEQWKMAKVFGF
ncbi:Protein CBG22884 [Caenorhabditis briggsae]|uniref:Protein CBG22884 n=1 Tax=Caenorhabditis briggsae TaxID=6238 RepID=A8Y3A6_CAEBR|nr:Protein CBG22884 [Caenorhabditis briggsae]CAP39375.1 Protein CBG22884 [Caenorhabditis briggsae]